MLPEALVVTVPEVVAYSDGAGDVYKAGGNPATDLQAAALATAEVHLARFLGFGPEARGLRCARYNVAPGLTGHVGPRPVVQPLTVGVEADYTGSRIALTGGYPFVPTAVAPYVEIAAGYGREGDTAATLAALSADASGPLGDLSTLAADPLPLPPPLFTAICEAAIFLGARIASGTVHARQKAVETGQSGVRITSADVRELDAIYVTHAGAYRPVHV